MRHTPHTRTVIAVVHYIVHTCNTDYSLESLSNHSYGHHAGQCTLTNAGRQRGCSLPAYGQKQQWCEEWCSPAGSGAELAAGTAEQR